MNDISLKIVESPKDPAGDAVSPSTLPSEENELDPLAIDDNEVVHLKDPTVEEAKIERLEGEKPGNCDENAKEKNLGVGHTSDKLEDSQTEETNEDLREENSPSTLSTGPVEVTEANNVQCVEESASTVVALTKELEKPLPVEDVVKEPEVTVVLKEPTPVKVIKVEEPKPQKVEPDADMTEVAPAVEKIELKVETKPKLQSMNGEVPKDDQATKRRASEDVETESPLKKLCQEVEKTFPQHDNMVHDYIQTATKNNVDEIQRHTEQLLSEIQTLRELAQKKEHEWNNILHLKKVKEEILLRLLRRKQVISFEKSADVNGSDRTDPFDYLNQPKNLAIDKSDDISGLAIKQPGSTMSPIIQTPIMPVTSHYNPMAGLPPPYDKAHMQNMQKPVYPQQMMMPGPLPVYPRDMNGQLTTSFGLPMGRQGPTKDVKSIIADYRQRNPDITPRRGRRMKSILNQSMMNTPRPIAPKMDSMNNLNNLNMLFNNLDMNQKAMLERLQQMQAGGLPNGLSFKDVLIQFANMQQVNSGLIPNRPVETVTNRPEHHIKPEGRRRQDRSHEEVHKQAERMASSPRLPPPPPYPEISLLPVTTSQDTSSSSQNSLLHGILTKAPASQSYSPTLAKLLTSSERNQNTSPLTTFGQAKNCGEITITPVQPTPPPPDPQPEKPEEVVQLDEEESPASEGEASGSPSGSGSGRLVIDEAGTDTGEAGASAGACAGGGGGGGAEAGATGGEGGEAPLCQGCRRRDAQFVCAGCANQWYCSRECQVAAWDDHSEMCSG